MDTSENDCFIHACESSRQLFKELTADAKDIYYDKDLDCIIINTAYHYAISMDRIKNKDDILEWVRHLSNKNWVTIKIIGIFIDVACHQINQNPWTRSVS